ncbi:hypothetical protein Enr13x_75290 [Stieleria neptunia]|uniref:Methyltransferase domain-containing protein n=1 Tax=Stieleria neptunia TaxID=2527979 RepID=A0A518I3J1_9BACT|nr:class I SAM-dependent methyltransferase [Stieleria neptunia]QDV47618.1 hypothetical protein Enr13x_75290 [Stieleria neptunia]
MIDTQPQSHVETQWWKTFYDDVAMVVLADQDPDTIRGQVDTITRLTGLSPGQSAMDQCCGLGQHACELASRGVGVIGVDQSALYIDHARQLARQRQVAAEFMVADALMYQHDRPVDVVYNWHSSFGYSPDDAWNQKMLHAAQQSLAAGGTMLLEFPNMLHLLAHFRTSIRSTHPDGVSLTRTSRISASTGTLHQVWEYHKEDRPVRTHESTLRIYLPDQLIQMFRNIGFVNVRAVSPCGDTLTDDSPRCIIVGRNPLDE